MWKPSEAIAMKNNKTMYELAKAKAIDYGPRLLGKYAGFYMTESELRILFAEEGFNIERPTMGNYVKVWRDLGRIFAVKPEGMEEASYFFLLDDGGDLRHILAAEKTYPTLHWNGLKAVMS